MSNPIAFSYYNKMVTFRNDFGSNYYAEVPEKGKEYLKFKIRCIERNHDDNGYCSLHNFKYDDIGIANSNIKYITMYFDIPKYFCDKDMKIKNELLQDNLLLDRDETEDLFFEFTNKSNCNGSGACHLYDTYIPVSIEYVTF